MLRLPPFVFRPARTVVEAVDLFGSASASGDEAMFVAGGTDLLPNMKRRQFEPAVLVGIRRIDEMRTITNSNRTAILGSGATLYQIARQPRLATEHTALVEACRQVATPKIQRMATLGGNLCVDTRCNYYNQTFEWRKSIGFCIKKDGDICLVAPGSSKCWAISSSDTAPALIALGASVRLVGPAGSRDVAVADLYRDDGINYMRRRPDELLSQVRVPRIEGLRSTYVKIRRRGSFDFPILGVAAAIRMQGNRVAGASLVLGAVHTHPVVVTEATDLVGHEPTAERLQAVAEAAQRHATPLDNADLTLYWRKQITAVTVRRALESLVG